MQNIFAIELVWIGLAKYATKILASIIYHNMAMVDYPTLFHSLSAIAENHKYARGMNAKELVNCYSVMSPQGSGG